jgi:hypothetical protein
MIELTCVLCGKKYKTRPYRASSSKYCSQTCYNIYRRKETKKIKTKCDTCGKEIWIYRFDIKNYKHHYCSKKCFAKGLSISRRGESHPNWKGRYKLFCPVCKEPFFVNYYKTQDGHTHFCSRECMNRFSGKKQREKALSNRKRVLLICSYCGKQFERKKSHSYSKNFCSDKCRRSWIKENKGEVSFSWKEHIKKKCLICGKIFEVVPALSTQKYCSTACRDKSREKRIETFCSSCGKKIRIFAFENIYKHHYCSRKCEWNGISLFYSGKNAAGWKGGISFSPYCPKFNDKTKEGIREKYNRRCFICGKSEAENKRRLSVHHINYDKKQGCNKKRWLLVPLCHSCHSKTNHNRDFWEEVIRNKLRRNMLGQIMLPSLF